MVHGGNHGADGTAIGEGQNGNFRAGEEFLNDHGGATLAEFGICHHVGDSFLGFFSGLGDDNTLAQRQTVGLDDGGDGGSFQIGQRSFQIGENFVSGSGNAVFLHQVLGKGLAAFDDGGICPGAEAGDAFFVQPVHATQHQRVVRGNHRIVDGIFHGEIDDAVNVRGADGDADGIAGDAAVTGEGENFRDFGILLQRADDGMLTATTANDH